MKTVFLFTCALSSLLSISALGQTTNGNPEQVVIEFYEALFSDKPTIQCPKLFSEPDVLARYLPDTYKKGSPNDSTAVVWMFLRDKKAALGFGGSDTLKQVKRARFGYLFSSYRSGAPFFEGGFSIVVMHKPSPNCKEGVFKQVVFPMEKSGPTSKFPYLIEPCAIRVNGALLETGTDPYDRSVDLWKLLGLK